MIIDIDIQISENNGKKVHRFTKRFDEQLGSLNESGKKAAQGSKFEDFLAEYLSASGKVIREKLINDLNTSIKGMEGAVSGQAERLRFSDYVSQGADSELEYKISIGNHNVLAGKIPFKRLDRIQRVNDILNGTEEEEGSLSSVQEGKETGFTGFHTYTGSGFISPPKEVEEIKTSLTTLMNQALQKYESSFYHTKEESENDGLEHLG